MSDDKKTLDLKSFQYLENGDVLYSALDTIKCTKTLDSGIYNITNSGYPNYAAVVTSANLSESVKIHNFPDKERIDLILSKFMDKDIKEKVTAAGFLHKLGILMYGAEGTGKSTIIKYFFSEYIKTHSAIVFYFNTYINIAKTWDFIMAVRQTQDNPIFIIFEEFDSHLLEKGNESILKSFIDGNLSIDNCIFFATTNYIDEIPDAIKNRPSRFKYSFKIEGIQDKNDVISIVRKILSDTFTSEEISEFSKSLTGSSIDTIKQFCLDKIMNIETISNTKNKIGFGK